MSTESDNLRRQLISIIKKFNFGELESAVLPQFPETSWPEIRSRLVHHHESFTAANVLRIIKQVIIDKQISNRDLSARLAQLRAIEVSRHYHKRKWFAYALNSTEEHVEEPSNETLRKQMIEKFHALQLNMEVQMEVHDGITFILIHEKSSRHFRPVIFALFLEQKVFFITKQSLRKEFLYILVESAGYTETRRLSLSGKNLISLVKILQLKNQGVQTSRNLCKSPVYRNRRPVVMNSGVDFTQAQQRRNFVEDLYGKEAPNIDMLHVTYRGMTWDDPEAAAMLPDTKFDLTWEFRSHNVPNFIAELAENRILTNPLPEYISKLLLAGKNELTVRKRNDNDTKQ